MKLTLENQCNRVAIKVEINYFLSFFFSINSKFVIKLNTKTMHTHTLYVQVYYTGNIVQVSAMST